MGRRGPPRTPTALAVVRGERRDRINTNEPIVPPGEVEPPDWMGENDLGKAARREWDLLAPTLIRMGLLTQIDRDAFARRCILAAHFAQAAALVDKSAVLVGGQRGLVKNPAMQIVRELAARLSAYDREFGLTPSARSEMGNGSHRRQTGDDLLTG